MPRALPLNLVNPADVQFTSDFVLAAASAAGIQLAKGENGTLKSEKASYVVFPALNYPNGIVGFIVDRQSVLLGTQRPSWMVIACEDSNIYILPANMLVERMAEATITPHPGMKVTEDVPGKLVVGMSLEWATYLGLIRKSFIGKNDGKLFKVCRSTAMVKPEKFVHLHNHSGYSLLDGASTIQGMVQQAINNGQPGLALTDHGFMFGTWKFYKECKKRGINPILGVEIYLVDDASKRYQHEGKDRRFEYHQTVLASNLTGWRNLCRLCTIACRDNYYYVPRVDHKTLFEHKEGLIVLSGCFKGPVAWHLQEFEQPTDGTTLPPWYRTDPDHSRAIMRMYRKELKENYYVEAQKIDFDRYDRAMPKIVQMAREEGIPVVVTNDNHYETTEDAAFQAMLTRISSSKVDNIGDVINKTGPYYIKSRDEIDPAGVLTPDMFDRTVEVMDKCNIEFPKGFLFPKVNIEEDADWAAFQESNGK